MGEGKDVAKKQLSKSDRALAERYATEEPPLSRKARVRIVELLAEFDPRQLANGAMYRLSRRAPDIESFAEAAPRILRREFGQEIEVDPSKVKQFCLNAEVYELVGFCLALRRTCEISNRAHWPHPAHPPLL
jgi:hypothetical protein